MAKGLGSRQPVTVEGVEYGSKTEAIVALHDRGLPQVTIAELVGSSTGSVAAVLSQQARKAKAAASEPDLTDGIWTSEKAAKVRRLFGKTMVHIADAVSVPPAELLKYVLHGVVPPSQKVQTADDIEWNDGNGLVEPALLPPPQADEPEDEDAVDADHLVEPSRDDDEAELAALQAAERAEAEEPPKPPVLVHSRQEVSPSPVGRFPTAKGAAPTSTTRALIPADGLFPANCEVRLVDKHGKYLHESLEAFTDKVKHAWKGGRQAFDVVKARMPKVVAKLKIEVAL